MISVKKWDKWQTFRKDRGSPPWIKLHRCLMTNPDWAILSDKEKGQLVSLWIIAADRNGSLPSSEPKVIQKIAQLDSPPNLPKFIELGFLTTTCQPDDNQMTATCQPDDNQMTHQSRVEESRVEKNNDHFVSFWDSYPRKIGKAKCCTWWERNVKTAELAKDILNGLGNHLPGWDETEMKYIPHPQTWLNRGGWEDEVEQPEQDQDDLYYGMI